MSRPNRFRAFLLLSLSAAVVGPGVWRAEAAPPKEQKESFAVVQVDAEYTVVSKASMKDFQKALNEKYAAAVKAHQQARKDAAKNKEKFTAAAPKRPKVRVLPKTFDSEQAASAYVAQLKEEDAKKNSGGTRR